MVDEQLFNNLKEQVLTIEENYLKRDDIEGKYVPFEDLIEYPTKLDVESNYLSIIEGKTMEETLKSLIDMKMDKTDLSVYVLDSELNERFNVWSGIINNLSDKVSGLDVYTKTEIDEILKNINSNDIDLSEFITKTELGNYMLKSELNSILDSKGYITEHQSLDGYVKNADLNKLIDKKLNDEFISVKNFYDKKIDDIHQSYIDTIENGGYVTKEDVIKSITDSLVNYINQEKLEKVLTNKDYVDRQYLFDYVEKYVSSKLKNNYLTKSDVEKFITKSDIPTKLSDFINDVGYLTKHQSLVDYVKRTDLINYVTIDGLKEVVRIINKEDENHLTKDDLVNYVKKSELPKNLSDLHNDVGYLTKHQSLVDYVKKSDITNYVTVNELDKRLSGFLTSDDINIPEVDLSGYAKKSDIPKNLSEIHNDVGYLTKHQSLVDYVKRTELEKYITIDELNEKLESLSTGDIVIPEIDLSIYAKKSDIPKNLSEIHNDVGYLTKHQSLTEYVKKSDLPDFVNIEIDKRLSDITGDEPTVVVPDIDLSIYAKKTDIPVKLSELYNDMGFLTKHQSLSGYVKKTELGDYITVSDFNKLNQSINSLESEITKFITKDELEGVAHVQDIPTKLSDLSNDMGFITKHQSLKDYVKKTELLDYVTSEELNKIISSLSNSDDNDKGFLTKEDLVGFAKETSIPTKISELYNDSGYITKHQSLSGYVKRTELDEYITLTEFDEFRKSIPNIDVSGFITKDELEGVAHISDIPTKLSELYNDVGYLTKHQSLTNYVKRNELVNFVSVDDFNESKLRLVSLDKDISFIRKDLESYLKKTDIPTKISSFFNDAGYLTEHQSLSGYVKKSELNDYVLVSDFNELKKFVNPVDVSGFITKDELEDVAHVKDIPTKLSDLSNDMGFITKHQSLSGYAKRTELNDYVTISDFNDFKNNISLSIDTSDFIKKGELEGVAHVSDIPTKLSELYNDAGYITKHQSLSGYVKRTELSEYVTSEELNKVISSLSSDDDHDGFLTKEDIKDVAHVSDIPTKLSELYNDAGYLTKHQPLTNYVKRNELNDYTLSSEFKELKSFVRSINFEMFSTKDDLLNYADKKSVPTKVSELLNDAGYLTKHQSLSGYVQRTELDNYVTQHQLDEVKSLIPSVDVDMFLTKDDLNGFAKEDYINSNFLHKSEKPNLSDYVKKDEMSKYVKKSNLPNFDDFVRVDNIPSTEGFVTEEELTDYVKLTDLPDLSEYVKYERLSTYVRVSDLEKYKKNVETKQYQTKTDIDNILNSYVKRSEIGTASSLDKETVEGMISQKIRDLKIPTKVSELINDKKYLTSHQSLSSYVKRNEISSFITMDDVNRKFLQIKDFTLPVDVVRTKDIKNLVSKDELLEATKSVVYKSQLSKYVSQNNFETDITKLENRLNNKYVTYSYLTDKLAGILGDSTNTDGLLSPTDLENYVKKDEFAAFKDYSDFKYASKDLLKSYVSSLETEIKNERLYANATFAKKSELRGVDLTSGSVDYDSILNNYYTKTQSHLQFLSKEDYRGIKRAATINFEFNDYPDLFFEVLNNNENMKINDGFYVIEEKAYIVRNNQIIPICDRRTPHWEIETTDEDWHQEGLVTINKIINNNQ